MEREMFTPPPEQDPGAPALGEEPRRPWNEEDDVLAKADCHDACVPLAEEIRRLESLCEVKRLELKDLREELAEAQAAHMAKTLSLKADQRILPLFDQRPADDAPPDDPAEPGRVDGEPVFPEQGGETTETPAESDWLERPLVAVLSSRIYARLLAESPEKLLTVGDLLRYIHDKEPWHAGIPGIGPKARQKIDEEIEDFIVQHEKGGGSDA